MAKGRPRSCEQGHRYVKTSDCPVCPVCEARRKPASGFLSAVSAPARRALGNAGIGTLARLSRWSESELLQLHGLGPSSIPKLRAALEKQGLSFRR